MALNRLGEKGSLYPEINFFSQGREKRWVLLDRSTTWGLGCFPRACCPLLPVLPGSLGRRGNQGAAAASWSRSIAGSSLWTSSSQVPGKPGKPWPRLLGSQVEELWTPVLMQTSSQSAGKSSGKVRKKCRWLGNLEVCLPASREGGEQVGWQKTRIIGMIKCCKLCLIFYRSHREHCSSSRVAEKLNVNRMSVNF